jgi:hypothetical protein
MDADDLNKSIGVYRDFIGGCLFTGFLKIFRYKKAPSR